MILDDAVIIDLYKTDGSAMLTVYSNKLRFNNATAEEMGYPDYAQLLFAGKENILALRAATSGSPNAFPFLPPGPDKHKRPIDINFLALVVTIRKYLKTENDQEKVEIPGIYYPQDKLMFFHINQAVYHNGRKRHFYNGENQVGVVKVIPQTEQPVQEETKEEVTPSVQTEVQEETITLDDEEKEEEENNTVEKKEEETMSDETEESLPTETEVKEPEQSESKPPAVEQPEEPEKVQEEVVSLQEQTTEMPVPKRRGRPKKSDQSDDGTEKEKKPKKKKHKRKKRKVKGVKEDVKDSVEVQTRKEEDEDVQDET